MRIEPLGEDSFVLHELSILYLRCCVTGRVTVTV